MPDDQEGEPCGREGGAEDADEGDKTSAEEDDLIGDLWSEDGGSFKLADTGEEDGHGEDAEEEGDEEGEANSKEEDIGRKERTQAEEAVIEQFQKAAGKR